MLSTVTNLISSRLNKNQTVSISSPLLTLNITKYTSDSLNSENGKGYAQIYLPSFCDLTSSKPIIKNTSNPTYKPPADLWACNSREIFTVVSKIFSIKKLLYQKIFEEN
jgi:hypothetical protein